MRFLLDESADIRIAHFLISLGHDVSSIVQEHPSLSDEAVLELAVQESRVLITNDLDFGELVFRQKHPHAGIVLFRLGLHASIEQYLARLQQVLDTYASQMDMFLVVESENVRAR